jgi:hypothetical protein
MFYVERQKTAPTMASNRRGTNAVAVPNMAAVTATATFLFSDNTNYQKFFVSFLQKRKEKGTKKDF